VIAARTYALHQIRAAHADPDRHYDVDASTRDQVYDGSMKEDFRASRSVQKTKGMVLTVGPASRPEPLKAFYHSTCGGMTELPQHVWGGSFAGFKHPVKCPYCLSSPALNWKLELSHAEMVQAFKRGIQVQEIHPSFAQHWPPLWRTVIKMGHLLALRSESVDPEGRVAQVVSVWQGPSGPIVLPLTGVKLREWLGAARFRSAAFQVTSIHDNRGGQQWRFEGRGNGHGVGMCQWGAKTMGERGFKTSAILKHYYPDAVLRKMW
jgi:stage II sporulation protein D